jgi:hypothetical protein
LRLDVFDGDTEFGATTLELCRVLQAWGEGNRVTHPGMDEPDAAPNTISWNNQPASDLEHPWSSVNIDKGEGPFSISFDITDLLKSWLDGTNQNYGVMIKGGEDSSYRFYFPSSEMDTSGSNFNKPALILHLKSGS